MSASTCRQTISPGRRIVARCDALGAGLFSDDQTLLFLPYHGPSYAAALEQIAAWTAEAGMTTWLDAAGNLIGRYEGARAEAPAPLIVSHIDSVRDGGRYDGPLGIMTGIECVATLHATGAAYPSHWK